MSEYESQTETGEEMQTVRTEEENKEILTTEIGSLATDNLVTK